MNYLEELNKAMLMLAREPNSIFVGQNVEYDGQRMHQTLTGVPNEKRLEFPVAENLQLGFCTGLSLNGYLPICSYPRIDFMLLALDQLVNHLDKIPVMSEYKPKVIVRTSVGSTKPFSAGPQHTQDHAKAFRLMLQTVDIYELHRARDVIPCYTAALQSDRSSILIEYMECYDHGH